MTADPDAHRIYEAEPLSGARSRLYQCPGCWSWGMYMVSGWLECECGERLDCVDLRGESRDDTATWDLHHAALGTPR